MAQIKNEKTKTPHRIQIHLLSKHSRPTHIRDVNTQGICTYELFVGRRIDRDCYRSLPMVLRLHLTLKIANRFSPFNLVRLIRGRKDRFDRSEEHTSELQ